MHGIFLNFWFQSQLLVIFTSTQFCALRPHFVKCAHLLFAPSLVRQATANGRGRAGWFTAQQPLLGDRGASKPVCGGALTCEPVPAGLARGVRPGPGGLGDEQTLGMCVCGGGSSTKEKGLMDTVNNMVRGMRGVNGNGKNTLKNKLKKKSKPGCYPQLRPEELEADSP